MNADNNDGVAIGLTVAFASIGAFLSTLFYTLVGYTSWNGSGSIRFNIVFLCFVFLFGNTLEYLACYNWMSFVYGRMVVGTAIGGFSGTLRFSPHLRPLTLST